MSDVTKPSSLLHMVVIGKDPLGILIYRYLNLNLHGYTSRRVGGIWVTQTRAYFLPRLPARSLSRPSPADILATLLFLLTNTLDFTSRRRPSDNSNFFRSFFLLLSLLNVDCDMRDKLKWGIRAGIPVLCPYGPPCNQGRTTPVAPLSFLLYVG